MLKACRASSIEALPIEQISLTEHGLFNEWFLFDFLLPNGSSPLEHYIASNPHQLEPDQLATYEQIRATQHYGLFEVMAIQLGSELELRDIYTNTTYQVRELKLQKKA